MHKALGVGVGQRVRYLPCDGHGSFRGQRPLTPDQLGQAFTVYGLHHQKQLLAILAAVINGDDVGVIEPAAGLQLRAKALGRGGVPVVIVDSRQLNGHVAGEERVMGEVDHSHAAGSEALLQLVSSANDAAHAS